MSAVISVAPNLSKDEVLSKDEGSEESTVVSSRLSHYQERLQTVKFSVPGSVAQQTRHGNGSPQYESYWGCFYTLLS